MSRAGCSVDRIREDRILHEALTAAADPLHLSLVFGVSHNTAARYATVAEHLLSDELELTTRAVILSRTVRLSDRAEPTVISSLMRRNAVGSR
jgi:hypothetical protein